ncbi:MAG TPA: TonB-dependent receptor [Pseudoalteromonas prydzensis]|uniref:TonB-dependent receptor n=1 Tax=Pseudoalteromonas prydzensis TaxID=182141 RepID=A0A7V1D0X4_9GAMM|nr:TonB-dependent receptor [Pseudoalteromonas prydzensis]HEA17882.1 TonB-dependent receptor [Pseudoalteromonas prydzensis]
MSNNKTSREFAALTRRFNKSALLLAVMASCNGAYAQANQAAQQSDLEVIEVRGIRSSTAENLAIKRLSAATVDAITAEDIGKFPDKNVADSLQRVSGVLIDRDGGEGSRVSIRGTSPDWTLTQLNGNYIASSGAGVPTRSFNYTLLPSSMISSVEVYKSAEARIDEGGIGGTVILHTRKPLEMEANSGAISLEATYDDVSEDIKPQVNVLYSWKNSDENFAMLAGFTRQDKTVTSITNNASHWRFHSDTVEGAERPAIVDQATGEVYNNVWAPRAMSTGNSTEDRTRDGYQVAIQWMPTDKLDLNLNYFGAKLDYNSSSQSVLFAEWNDNHNPYYGVVLDGDTVVAYGNADNGLLNDNNWGDADVNNGVAVRRGLLSPQLTGRERVGESKSDTFDFEAKYYGDLFTATLKLGHTEAEGGTSRETYANIDARQGSVNSWFWSTVDGKPSYEVSTDLATDKQAYQYYDWFDSYSSENKDTEDYVQADLQFDIDTGIFTTFFVGAKYRSHEIKGIKNDFRWDDGIADNGGYRGYLSGSEWFHNPDFHPDPESLVSDTVVDNSAGNTGAFNFLAFDFAALDSYLRNNFTQTVVPSLGGTYTLEENIWSVYAQSNFEWQDFRGNLGVRYVNTDLSTLTYDDVVGQDNNDTTANERSSDDGEFLPSFNLAWDATEDLVVRFAAARAMSRVSYSDLSQAESYGPPVNINSPDSWTGRGTGTSVNTGLDPMLSDQFDLGIEWYYGEGSALGATYFSKDISNLPISAVEIVEREHDCCNGPIEVEMNTKVAGGDAESKGVELFFQHSFNSGFGVLANYTFTDTSTSQVSTNGQKTDAEIPGTAKHQYNVSVYFENDDFSVRASYNWKDDRANSIHQGYNMYTKDYGQLDLNAAYNLTEQLSLTASVVNLTEEVEEGYWKQENRFTYNQYSGRRFYLGANYNF